MWLNLACTIANADICKVKKIVLVKILSFERQYSQKIFRINIAAAGLNLVKIKHLLKYVFCSHFRQLLIKLRFCKVYILVMKYEKTLCDILLRECF